MLTIFGGNLFLNETVDGENNSWYTFTQSDIGLKCKLVFHAFGGNKVGVTNL